MRRLAILGLMLLCLAACSSTRFAYRHADWFINWSLDDYVALNKEQQAVFDTALDDWLNWHCTTELPRYQSYLQDLSAALVLESGLTDAALQSFAERAAEAWAVLVSRALQDALPILRSLDEEQVTQLLTEVDEQNKRFYKDYVAINQKELEQLRVDRVSKAMKRWLSNSSKTQTHLTADWARQATNIYPLLYGQRQQWRSELQRMLGRRSDDDFYAALSELLLQSERFYTLAEREQLQASRQDTRHFLLSLERSLSQRQRDHLLAELDEITEDIRQLTATCSPP